MRPGFINSCLASLCFLIASAASPRDSYRERGGGNQTGGGAGGGGGGGGGDDMNMGKEPSCDELRAMWRFSKRQSRAAESTNEIPTYRDPFAYNVWEDHATIRSVGGGKARRPVPVYGRLVHAARTRLPDRELPERVRSFEEVARLFGMAGAGGAGAATGGGGGGGGGGGRQGAKAHGRRRPSARLVGGAAYERPISQQAGSFQHLKEIIQLERARELHEQRMSEEAAQAQARQYRPKGLGAYQYQYQYQPAAAGRSRSADAVLAFPDVLAPPAAGYDAPPPPPPALYPDFRDLPRSYRDSDH